MWTWRSYGTQFFLGTVGMYNAYMDGHESGEKEGNEVIQSALLMIVRRLWPRSLMDSLKYSAPIKYTALVAVQRSNQDI
jgi:hypothetical protein